MTAQTAPTLDLSITQGKTYTASFRWSAPPYVYAAITGIANTAPLRITAPSHGMPDGWRFAISGVVGPTVLNAAADPPRKSDFYIGTFVDANTIDINDVNGTLLPTYVSGGTIQFLTPVDVSAMSARMMIRDKIGGTVLWQGTTGTGELTITAAQSKIAVEISAADTAALTGLRGVYDIEMVTAGSPEKVDLLVSGRVFVTREVSHAG